MPLQQPFCGVVYRELWPLARARRNACAAAHLLYFSSSFSSSFSFIYSTSPILPRGDHVRPGETRDQRPEFAAASNGPGLWNGEYGEYGGTGNTGRAFEQVPSATYWCSQATIIAPTTGGTRTIGTQHPQQAVIAGQIVEVI
ncbi:hypothetical protein M5D96_006084 [Drosophila gunungcola]|uniref:Uncharacterized protein n=1 Tax=Drosophila gunungcola TaxID=103775 RepID=A0A9P9YRG9_9MUSC|nr:hypothetical protein M5D96_006084 [Drosophila gunungcola]